MIKNLSDLFHMKQYDCKVYTLDKHISRRWKLQKRVHIDHLVDYEIRNLFRIWIFNQQKIIRSRNVMFDKEKKYDAHDVDLVQTIQKLMIETMYDTTNLNYISQIKKIESNDDLMIINEIDQDKNSFVLLSQFEEKSMNDSEQQLLTSLNRLISLFSFLSSSIAILSSLSFVS